MSRVTLAGSDPGILKAGGGGGRVPERGGT